MPINAEEINARLEPLRYVYFTNDQGAHFVSALYGHACNKYFETDDKLNTFVTALEQSDQWELHYATGAVDVDRDTGTITPHDGTREYNAGSVADSYSARGPLNSPKNAANAEFITIRSVARPPYGGNWYKVRPNMCIPLPK